MDAYTVDDPSTPGMQDDLMDWEPSFPETKLPDDCPMDWEEGTLITAEVFPEDDIMGRSMFLTSSCNLGQSMFGSSSSDGEGQEPDELQELPCEGKYESALPYVLFWV